MTIVDRFKFEDEGYDFPFYNKNPHQKLCMDDAEKASFSKALWIVKEYNRQQKMKAVNNEINQHTK